MLKLSLAVSITKIICESKQLFKDCFNRSIIFENNIEAYGKKETYYLRHREIR